ncbi:hypothetical protein SUGI_1179950 [Cryptomeria japonica]|nr:hypothetical protein SUGI_1179950 [Cryptomeria japonica]
MAKAYSRILRLLNGWVTGSGYGYELLQGYKSGMGEMLLVKTNTSRPSNGLFDPEMYSGVELSAEGREAALLLSVDDKVKLKLGSVISLKLIL